MFADSSLVNGQLIDALMPEIALTFFFFAALFKNPR
jgi:hypothetical protein